MARFVWLALLLGCASPRHPTHPVVLSPSTSPLRGERSGQARVEGSIEPLIADWDHGQLDLTLRGKPFGHEVFSIEQHATGYQLRAEVHLTAGSVLRLLDSELSTDRAWRPITGRFRDVKDGGTISTLDGSPLVLRGTAPFAPPSERTASRDIELFLADNTMSHFAPLCAIAAPGMRTAFPGMAVTVGPDEPIGGRMVRRRLDLGGSMRVLLACEDARLVAVEVPMFGLTAVRTGRGADIAAAVATRRGKPELAAGLVEDARTIRVPRGGGLAPVELACSLVTPATPTGGVRPRWPAVLLLTGSGAQDRDGDSVGDGGVKPGLLKVLAGALGTAGVVSLRCDDRGTAASTGTYGEATLDTFIGDAAAMVKALRRERTVDHRRVIVVGHSEGAVVATRLAARDRGLAGIALLAGPGRQVDTVLLEQVESTLRRAGLTDDEIADALAQHQAAFEAIRAGEPLPDTAEAREWSGGEGWLASHLRVPITETAATLDRVAVLVAQGGVDQQVSMADADALVIAFRASGNSRVTVVSYPNLDHNFTYSATGDVAEYVDPDRTIDATFVADVVSFVTTLR